MQISSHKPVKLFLLRRQPVAKGEDLLAELAYAGVHGKAVGLEDCSFSEVAIGESRQFSEVGQHRFGADDLALDLGDPRVGLFDALRDLGFFAAQRFPRQLLLQSQGAYPEMDLVELRQGLRYGAEKSAHIPLGRRDGGIGRGKGPQKSGSFPAFLGGR